MIIKNQKGSYIKDPLLLVKSTCLITPKKYNSSRCQIYKYGDSTFRGFIGYLCVS